MIPAAGSQASVKDTLGCSLRALVRDQSLASAGLSIFRKTSAQTAPSEVATPESDRGLLLGVSLSGQHSRHILRDGHLQRFDFTPGSIYLRSFAEPYAAQIATPFDFLLIEMPKDALSSAAETTPDRVAAALPTVQAEPDPVIFHLAHALLPALERPGSVNALVVDQIALAMQTHLLTRFAGIATASHKEHCPSPMQETRCKELLLTNLRGDLLVADLAAACGLSRSVFMRAFKATTGTTPHQWLLAQRIERAKILLATTGLSIAEIASRSGFADQSHLTRIFTRVLGVPPGAWRERV